MHLAYFDESGIDGAHDITIISGFVGNLHDWASVNAAWQAQLVKDGVPSFHYIDCVNQERAYVGWDWFSDCQPHLERMAQIISNSPIGGISVGFLGDWNGAVKDRPDLAERFPSPYSFCFEAMVNKIRDEMHHHGQPDMTMVMSKQQQFQRRALEVWDWHRDRNAWPEIANVTYAEPSKVMGLQMADMLAWETRRHLFKGGATWRTLPLLSRLVPKEEQMGNTLYERAYREKHVREIRRREDPSA